MTKPRMAALPVALAVAALGMMMFASISSATHPRPKGATPLFISLAIAYEPCPNATVPASNRTHGGTLAFPSCNPPVQTSASLTVGTPDANGAAANSIGSIRNDVCPAPGCAAPDVKFTSTSSDVRCKAGVVTCGAANTADGPDYVGEVQGEATIRVTDHTSDTTPPSCGAVTSCKTATMVDVPFAVTATCVGTPADATIGSSCAITTTANTVVPGAVVASGRGNVEVGQVHVNDGGADGTIGTTAGNTVFARQGIFIP